MIHRICIKKKIVYKPRNFCEIVFRKKFREIDLTEKTSKIFSGELEKFLLVLLLFFLYRLVVYVP